MVTAPPKSVATATDAVLTCTVTEITQQVTVTWKNADGHDLAGTTGPLDQYTVDPGTFDPQNSNQESTLTITPTGMNALSDDVPTAFTCVVKSGEYATDSPDVSATTAVLTKLTYGTFKLHHTPSP